MSKFQIGDWVECVSGYDDGRPKGGWKGTVVSPHGDYLMVDWDGHGKYECRYHRLRRLPDPKDERIAELEARVKELDAKVPPDPEEYVDVSKISHGSAAEVFIGSGLAPYHLRDRCLMFKKERVQWVEGEHNGYSYIAFKLLEP